MPPPSKPTTSPFQATLNQSDLAATLGYITTLGKHIWGQTNPGASQSPQNAPQATQQAQPQQDLTPRIADLESQFTTLKTDVQKEIKSGIDEVKGMITEALKQDGPQ